VSGYADPTVAGASHPITVAALDNDGNVDTGYRGTVHFTSTDTLVSSGVGLPADYAFLPSDVGTRSLAFTLETQGGQTITATDTSTLFTATTPSIAVGPGPVASFTMNAPSSVTAGAAFTFTVSAFDAFGNPDSTYSGLVHFTSSNAGAVLPADSTLTNGTRRFGARLVTAPSQTITATDTVNSAVTITSGPITVVPAAATHFQWTSTPATAPSGRTENPVDSSGRKTRQSRPPTQMQRPSSWRTLPSERTRTTSTSPSRQTAPPSAKPSLN